VFLSDAKNRDRIRESGEKLADEISRFVLAKRQKLAGSFLEKASTLRLADIDLGKLDVCKDLSDSKKFASRPSGAASDEFAVCWRAAWARIEPPVTALLKSADDYDQLADAGDGDNAKIAFKELSEALSAIAEGSVTNPDELWRIATRLIAFGEKVEAAISKESRDKMRKAIEDLANAV